MSDDIAVGIDLGTSYSAVAAAAEAGGAPNVLPNEWGERTHASVVSFLDDGSVLVGNNAKRNIITNA
jgi:molecular chaperone DnaK